MGPTTVDYLTLDIEGFEILVLKTIPSDRVDFKVLVVKYKHHHPYSRPQPRTHTPVPGAQRLFTDLMATMNYTSLPLVRKPHWQDIVLVKNGFTYKYDKPYTVNNEYLSKRDNPLMESFRLILGLHQVR